MKVAICFYTPQTYEQLKSLAADRNKLDDNYEDWLSKFQHAMNTFKNSGLDVVPFKVNMDQLQEWCKLHKYKNTGKHRSQYVSEMAEKQAL